VCSHYNSKQALRHLLPAPVWHTWNLRGHSWLPGQQFAVGQAPFPSRPSAVLPDGAGLLGGPAQEAGPRGLGLGGAGGPAGPPAGWVHRGGPPSSRGPSSLRGAPLSSESGAWVAFPPEGPPESCSASGWRRYGAFSGPCTLCGLSSSEVMAALELEHSCEVRLAGIHSLWCAGNLRTSGQLNAGNLHCAPCALGRSQAFSSRACFFGRERQSASSPKRHLERAQCFFTTLCEAASLQIFFCRSTYS